MVDEATFAATRVWIDAEGIAHGEALPGSSETIEGARAMIEHLRKCAGGRRLALVMDIRQGRAISREARSYLGSREIAEVVGAGALVVGSALSRSIGNFYLAINRPSWPVRIFTDEQDALAWLRQQGI